MRQVVGDELRELTEKWLEKGEHHCPGCGERGTLECSELAESELPQWSAWELWECTQCKSQYRAVIGVVGLVDVEVPDED